MYIALYETSLHAKTLNNTLEKAVPIAEKTAKERQNQ